VTFRWLACSQYILVASSTTKPLTFANTFVVGESALEPQTIRHRENLADSTSRAPERLNPLQRLSDYPAAQERIKELWKAGERKRNMFDLQTLLAHDPRRDQFTRPTGPFSFGAVAPPLPPPLYVWFDGASFDVTKSLSRLGCKVDTHHSKLF